MFLEYSEDKITWVPFCGEIHLGRNYRTFGYLTNGAVRDHDINLKMGIDPRGLPDNLGYEVQQAVKDFGEECHNFSWLSYREYKNILEQIKKDEYYEDGIRLEYILLLKMMKFLKKRGNKVRIIFFFDS